ncbi:hypothetical protein [Sphingobium nicotianae]|uniref:Uncharacterized protein n=1 Tax=Sphingobium nicotianae TaxID=2782607 RepID=A0A9X1AI01_9SPHN|nr:hypothetical protein [Sphingobium nicotianae]MBT2185362.1 hypothetical protein [Sphingobium nicotianae]
MQSGEIIHSSAEPRKLSLWLIVGVYILPILFAWFLLRPGYSPMAREGAFLPAGFSLIVVIVHALSPY